MNYLTGCYAGVNLFRRLKGFIIKKLLLRKFLLHHYISVYIIPKKIDDCG